MKRAHWGWVVAGGVLAITVGYYEGRKYLLDLEVERLCAIDGGIKVYEEVRLPLNKFDEFGIVNVPFKDAAKVSDEFFYEWNITYYKKGNPGMSRNEFKLFRRSDVKLLGEAISYWRSGGDLPGPWHDSSFGCPSDGDISLLKKRIFVQATKGRKS